MSLPGADRREVQGPSPVSGGGNGVAVASDLNRLAIVASNQSTSQRLRLNPNKDHKPDSYEDLQLDFSPSIFSSLERYLPPTMLALPRDDKVKFMKDILLKYLPHGERNRVCLCVYVYVFFFFSFFLYFCVVCMEERKFQFTNLGFCNGQVFCTWNDGNALTFFNLVITEWEMLHRFVSELWHFFLCNLLIEVYNWDRYMNVQCPVMIDDDASLEF